MPRPSIDLGSYKAEIISLFRCDHSADSIAKILHDKYNLQITDRTIRSRLQEWGIRKRNRTISSDPILHRRIKILFFQVGLEEKEMLQILQAEGFEITARTLRRLRSRLGLRRRTKPIEAQLQVEEVIREIQSELDKGTIEGYGKEFLHRHFRSKGFMISR
jgi:Clr5 domain